MLCPKCGTQVDLSNGKYCEECGTDVNTNLQQTQDGLTDAITKAVGSFKNVFDSFGMD